MKSQKFLKISCISCLSFHSPEIQAGYTFKINPTLTLRPYAAVTAYFVDAGQHVEYKFTTPSGVFEIVRDHAESFSWSVGPKAGTTGFMINATVFSSESPGRHSLWGIISFS